LCWLSELKSRERLMTYKLTFIEYLSIDYCSYSKTEKYCSDLHVYKP
jgi:hypothetical protein